MKTLAILAVALSATAAHAQVADPNADIPILSAEDVKKLQDSIPKTAVAVEPGAEPDAMPAADPESDAPPTPPVLVNPPVTVPPDMMTPTDQTDAGAELQALMDEPAPPETANTDAIGNLENDAHGAGVPIGADPGIGEMPEPAAGAPVDAAPVLPLPEPATDLMKEAYMAEPEAVRLATQEAMLVAGTYADVVDGLYGRKTQAGLIGLSVLIFETSEGAERHPLTTAEEISAFMRWIASGAAQPYIN